MSTAPRRRTLPTPDLDSAGYWRSLADGRFTIQHCRECGRFTWPVRPICSGCHGRELEVVESPGTGTVYSWIVTHQPYGPDLAELVPYPVALVQLDEQDDIFVPGRYTGDAELRQGLRVRMRTEVAAEDIGVLVWDVDD